MAEHKILHWSPEAARELDTGFSLREGLTNSNGWYGDDDSLDEESMPWNFFGADFLSTVDSAKHGDFAPPPSQSGYFSIDNCSCSAHYPRDTPQQSLRRKGASD
jgi:hypothetical protein